MIGSCSSLNSCVGGGIFLWYRGLTRPIGDPALLVTCTRRWVSHFWSCIFVFSRWFSKLLLVVPRYLINIDITLFWIFHILCILNFRSLYFFIFSPFPFLLRLVQLHLLLSTLHWSACLLRGPVGELVSVCLAVLSASSTVPWPCCFLQLAGFVETFVVLISWHWHMLWQILLPRWYASSCTSFLLSCGMNSLCGQLPYPFICTLDTLDS